MYGALKELALRVMRTPTEAPEPPAGSHDSIQIYRASPSFLTYRLVGFWILFAVLWLVAVVLVIAGLASGEPAPLVLGVLAVPLLVVIQFLAYFAARIDYDLRYYIVTDRSLRVREGALVVKEMTLTHANVQNLRVTQGPLLRIFGIKNLEVDTAGGGGAQQGRHGGSGHKIVMAGIENANDVRDLILGHLRARGQDTGLGDLDDTGDSVPDAFATESVVEALRELRRATAGLLAAAEN